MLTRRTMSTKSIWWRLRETIRSHENTRKQFQQIRKDMNRPNSNCLHYIRVYNMEFLLPTSSIRTRTLFYLLYSPHIALLSFDSFSTELISFQLAFEFYILEFLFYALGAKQQQQHKQHSSIDLFRFVRIVFLFSLSSLRFCSMVLFKVQTNHGNPFIAHSI